MKTRHQLAAVASVLCWSFVAAAQVAPPLSDTQLAEQHFNKGFALVEAADYEAAAVEFELAYQKSPHYSVLYNLGLSYARASKHVQAVVTLRRFLAEADQADVEMSGLAQNALRKSEQFVGTVSFDVVAEATVMLDGQELTRPTEPHVLSVGTHGVWARAAGHRDGYRSFVVHGGGVSKLALELEPLPAEPASIEPKSKPKPVRHPQQPPSHLWSYVLGGTGLALGAGAIALYVNGSAEHRDLQARRDQLAQEYTGGMLSQRQSEAWSRLMSDSASQQRWDDVAVGLGVCAGVSLGTAIALFWSSSPSATERADQVSFDGRSVAWSSTW